MLLRKDIIRYYQLKKVNINSYFFMCILSLFNIRLYPVILFRISCFFYKNRLSVIANIFSLINLLFFGIETTPKTKIQGGLFLPHTIGTILGAYKIGENVTIMHGVTLGSKYMDFHFTEHLRPTIGDNVFIGSGAKILGGIKIGNGSKIGANAVVLKDVPSNVLAVGVPAKHYKIK